MNVSKTELYFSKPKEASLTTVGPKRAPEW